MGPTSEGAAADDEAMPRLTPAQQALVAQLRRAVTKWELAPQLLPLPTTERVLSDDGFDGSPRRVRQKRLLALLAVDAAIEAARASHGGHNACAGVHVWLLRKAAELGLDVNAELVRAALGDDDDADAATNADVDSDAGSDDAEEEGPVASEEVQLTGVLGRVLVQFELSPLCQRLTLSLVSLNAADLGAVRLRYTFAIGLTSAYLLEAESHELAYVEFAEWRSAERGALVPAEGLPPAASVERRAKAFIAFFRCGDGAQPPLAPRVSPDNSAWL